MFTDRKRMRTAFRAVGDLLSSNGHSVAILVVGGAALNLLGMLERATIDVDVIALVDTHADGTQQLVNADPFSVSLANAISSVARDLGLPSDWMNHEVALQWKAGLPPDILADVTWERHGGLSVGLVGRQTQITLKLFAAVDQGVASVHMQDLLLLRPAADELSTAPSWVFTQDAGDDFPRVVIETADHVVHHTR